MPSPAGVEVIEASDTHLWLNPRVSVDFKETVAWATSILDPTGTAQQPHDPGLQVLRDDLLPEWYEDWVLVERERFRQLRLHALEAICERFTEEGKYGLALEAGLAAVAAEPLREVLTDWWSECISRRATWRRHPASTGLAHGSWPTLSGLARRPQWTGCSATGPSIPASLS